MNAGDLGSAQQRHAGVCYRSRGDGAATRPVTNERSGVIRLTQNHGTHSPATLSVDPCSWTRNRSDGLGKPALQLCSAPHHSLAPDDGAALDAQAWIQRHQERIAFAFASSMRFLETKDAKLGQICLRCCAGQQDRPMSAASTESVQIATTSKNPQFLEEARQLLHKRLKVRSSV